MYLLDTNIVSELRKAKSGRSDKNVKARANSVFAACFFLFAITILEMETGVLLIERRDPTQGAISAPGLMARCCRRSLAVFSRLMLPLHNDVQSCMCLTHERSGTR